MKMTRRTRSKLEARRWARDRVAEVPGDAGQESAPVLSVWLRRPGWETWHLFTTEAPRGGSFVAAVCDELREKESTIWLEGRVVLAKASPRCYRCERLARERARCETCGADAGRHVLGASCGWLS